MYKKYIPVAIFLLCAFNLKAQTLEWQLGFFGFADNREYSASGRNSPTLIGLQLAPEVALAMDSTHKIHLGMNLLHEYGSDFKSSEVHPTIYYKYQKEHIRFYMGLFPRQGLVDDYSNAMLSDTLQYYKPNLGGMLFRYEKQKIIQQLWIDWYGKQSPTQREQFLVGISGNIKFNKLFVGHEGLLWHNALPLNADENTHIQDNAGIRAYVGIDMSSQVNLDSLSLSAGGLFSFNRDRGLGLWQKAKGVMIEGHAAYKSFYLHNILYLGEPQHLALGDDFYSEDRYNRLDLGWAPFRNKRLSAKLALSFHFTPGAVDNQQTLHLRYNIGAKHQLVRNQN